VLDAGDWIPDNKATKVLVFNIDEDMPMVAIHGPPFFTIKIWLRQGGYTCGGDETGHRADIGWQVVVEEAKERRRWNSR
jgi:hypothetical protein